MKHVKRRRARMTPRQLAVLLGEVAAARLIETWGGHVLPRITADVRRRRERDEALRAYLDRGTSIRDAAEKFGICERHVLRIANGK